MNSSYLTQRPTIRYRPRPGKLLVYEATTVGIAGLFPRPPARISGPLDSGIMVKKCWKFLGFTEVEVPREVVGSIGWGEAAVLSVARFQPAEVAFNPVCGTRDGRFIEVVEHMRQSI